MSESSSLKFSLSVFRGYQLRFLAALMALCLATLVGYAIPLVTRTAIDRLVEVLGRHGTGPAGAAASEIRGPLVAATAAILLLAAAHGIFMYFKGRWSSQATEGAIRNLRDRLYQHLHHLPCQYFDQTPTGDLVQRCTSDTETVRHFVENRLQEMGRGIVLLVTVLPIMLWMDLRMSLISLAGVPLIIGFSIVFFRRIQPRFTVLEEAESELTAVVQENLTGIRVVRAFARQDYERSKFARVNAHYRDRHYRLIQLLGIFWAAVDLMVFLQQLAVLLGGAWLVAHQQLSVGTLVAFLLLVNLFIWPIRILGRLLTEMGKALVSLGRIEQVLAIPVETPGEPLDTPRPPAGPSEPRGAVRLTDVTFHYPYLELPSSLQLPPRAVPPALQNVSFELPAGKTLAIFGPPAAGKSTLVALLLRLYDGYQGAIALDGQEISQADRKWVRSQIGVIMQEPFLYSKTVRDNIALGRPDATQADIEEAARIARVHDNIVRFRDGYDTLVGERGVTLSGGQRQRIALARALLQPTPLLVLDDALSAVDMETEQEILSELKHRFGQQTVILIAHRISALRTADYILALERGEIQQQGDHRTLVEQEGLYRRLYRLQTGVPGLTSSG